MKNLLITILGASSALILTACNGGGGDEGITTVAGGGRGGTEYGFVTLSITDAPVDYATEVWVQFDGVEFMPSSDSSNQEPILVMLDSPVKIDLLELQGMKSKPLLVNEILPTGIYDWVKLKITAVKDGVMDSYIVLYDGTMHELDMPSGSEVGLKIVGGMEVIANTPSEKTIDFDLRKSIIMNGLNDFKIVPALNLVSNDQTGSIKGTIKLSALVSPYCSDFDPFTGNAVYLYEGFNVSPDDLDDDCSEPAASALVNFNKSTGMFEYTFGFVPFGKYTAVFTCEADLDDQDSDDDINYSTSKNVNITGTDTIYLGSNTFRFKKN